MILLEIEIIELQQMLPMQQVVDDIHLNVLKQHEIDI